MQRALKQLRFCVGLQHVWLVDNKSPIRCGRTVSNIAPAVLLGHSQVRWSAAYMGLSAAEGDTKPAPRRTSAHACVGLHA